MDVGGFEGDFVLWRLNDEAGVFGVGVNGVWKESAVVL